MMELTLYDAHHITYLAANRPNWNQKMVFLVCSA